MYEYDIITSNKTSSANNSDTTTDECVLFFVFSLGGKFLCGSRNNDDTWLMGMRSAMSWTSLLAWRD